MKESKLTDQSCGPSKATIILARASAIEFRIRILPAVASDSIVCVHCSSYQQQEGFALTRLFDKLALSVLQGSWLCKADAVAPVRFRLIERQIGLAQDLLDEREIPIFAGENPQTHGDR